LVLVTNSVCLTVSVDPPGIKGHLVIKQTGLLYLGLVALENISRMCHGKESGSIDEGSQLFIL
jgi:hypothetical protein